MTKTELWHDLEAQFRELDPFGLLRADGTYTLGSSEARGEMLYQWALRGEASWEARFRVLAHKAGAALGQSDLDPLAAWLQNLTTESRFFRIETPQGVEQREDGTIVRHFVLATINNICRASAEHCVNLQLVALKAEQLAGSAPEPLPKTSVPTETSPLTSEIDPSAYTEGTAPEVSPEGPADGSEHTLSPIPSEESVWPLQKRRQYVSHYDRIDKLLREIGKAKPEHHAEVFTALDARAPIPRAEPFKSAKGWLAGFRKNPHVARAWLSKRWAQLQLPHFPRGPKR